MKAEELTIPEFILGEVPIKDGSIQDQRSWIFCPRALSLIEVIPEEELTVAIHRYLVQKKFTYLNSQKVKENFLLVIVQNNCEFTSINPIQLLEKSWQYYLQYLKWEDENLDVRDSTTLN